MSLPTKFFFMRHGETFLNKKNKISGITNTRLTKQGISELIKIKKKINNLKVNKVYISKLIRTKQTMQIVLPKKKFEIIESFNERNWGNLEKKTKKLITDFNIKPKNGESLIQFEKRILKTINQNTFSEKSLFCLHKGVLKVFLKKTNIPLQNKYFENSTVLEFEKKRKKYLVKII